MKLTPEQIDELEKQYVFEILKSSNKTYGQLCLENIDGLKMTLGKQGPEGMATIMEIYASNEIEYIQTLLDSVPEFIVE
jgi:hypothetical protein